MGSSLKMDAVKTPEIPSPQEAPAADVSRKAMAEVQQLVAADDRKDFEFA